MKLPIALAASLLIAGAACGASSTGEPGAGERIYTAQCFSCHAVEPGANTPAGPTLHDIVGRPIAAETGFDYSPALRRLAAQQPRWTPALLDRFIAAPQAVARGTEMGFGGLRDAGERRMLIEWLAGRSDD